MSLSSDFKESLKQRLIQEASSAPQITVSTVPKSDNSDIYEKIKVYKYVSMAACLMAIISTIGVVTLMSSRFSVKNSSVDDNNNMSASQGNNDMYHDSDVEVDERLEDDSLDEIPLGEPVFPADYIQDVTAFDSANPNAAAVDDASEYDTFSEEAPVEIAESIPKTDSDNIAPNYSGEYSTYDYVLGLNRSASYGASNVFANSTALKKAASESSSMPTYREASNFYDILGTRLKDESELLGASLVKLTVNGIMDEAPTLSPAEGIYTAYSVNIRYDYLNQSSCDIDACVWIKGSVENQIEGMPVYAQGDDIFTSLYVCDNGSVTAVDELLYDVYTLSSTDIAYHRYYQNIDPGYTNMGILDMETEFITTTQNNPVRYVHKSAVKELSRYIRRKIVGENYEFADLKKLARISLGEEDLSVPADVDPQPSEDDPSPDTDPSQETTDPETPSTVYANITVTSHDDRLTMTADGTPILLGDKASAQFIISHFQNSISGSTGSDEKSYLMFVGGKIEFNHRDYNEGEMAAIEITSAGCPLDISFRGVKVGNTLESVKNALRINYNLGDSSTLTYKGETINAVLTFEYGILTKINIQLA